MNYFCFNVQHNRPFICFLWDSLLNEKNKERREKFFTNFHFTKNCYFHLIKKCKITYEIDSPQFRRYSYKAIDYSSIDYLLTNHNSNVILPIDPHRRHGDCVNFPHDKNCYLLLNLNNGFANQTLPRNTSVMASLAFMC